MTSSRSLGFIEVPFFSITALVADYLVKATPVSLLGFEPLGDERLLIRARAANGAALQGGMDACTAFAQTLGVEITTSVMHSPSPELHTLNQAPVTLNPLYGGRDEMKPQPIMKTTTYAIGILETQGLTAMLEATDAMLKAADVQLVGKEKIGAAYVTIIVKGDVAAVSAAIESGKHAVGNLGKLIAAHVIARPHDELLALLPKQVVG